MALETISQILSSPEATYVNGVSARRDFSKAVLENLFQNIVESKGRGVSDKFVSEQEANDAAQIFVNRVLPLNMQPREQGASKNGASYSASSHFPKTTTVAIDILTIVDDPIHLPRARQDWIPIDLLVAETYNYSQELATIINGATYACKILGWANAKAGGKGYSEVKVSADDITNKKVAFKLIEANSLLDEGDLDNGIDIFPEESRIAVFKVGFRPTLLASGILTLGGANYAYDILAKGGVSHEATPTKLENGYIGVIDGVPCHVISNGSLLRAAGFCGYPDREFIDGKVIGYVSSSYANARGVSTVEQTKVVDDPNGQGLILQPLTKLGVACWYPKGNAILLNDDFSPVEDLADIFAGVTGITYSLKAKGSRLYPYGEDPIAALTTTAFTVSGITAKDDWGTDHLKKVAYFVSDKAVKTVGDYCYGYGVATEKGLVTTLGASQNFTATQSAGKYLNICAIADDGSVTLYSKEIE